MPPWFNFDLPTESHLWYHGITSVVYGINNLPITVNMANGKQIQYYGVYPALRGNANGSRIQKYDGQTNTYYVIGAGGETEAVVAVQSSSVNVTYNTWAGGDNIGQISITNLAYNRYYYLKDHLGSIRVTVNSNGNVDSYNDYYPFGLQMPNRNGAGTADGRFKYTGKEQDVETTLDYFGARYYDSWRGQWLSVDPMEEKYLGWDPYNYCEDNSIRNIDPYGMDLSDFYDLQGNHKHIDDKDQNAYLVTQDNMKNIDSKNAEQVKTDNSTVSLGSNADLVSLAKVVFNEARGETKATQIAIAFTVLNRSDISGKTVSQEAFKHNQFSGIGRWAKLTLENASATQKADLMRSYSSAIVSLMLHCYDVNPVGSNVTSFYSPSSPTDRPWWGDKEKEIELSSPFNEGNFVFWHDLPPYVRK